MVDLKKTNLNVIVLTRKTNNRIFVSIRAPFVFSKTFFFNGGDEPNIYRKAAIQQFMKLVAEKNVSSETIRDNKHTKTQQLIKYDRNKKEFALVEK